MIKPRWYKPIFFLKKEWDSNIPPKNRTGQHYFIRLSIQRYLMQGDKWISFGRQFKKANSTTENNLFMLSQTLNKLKWHGRCSAINKLELVGWKIVPENLHRRWKLMFIFKAASFYQERLLYANWTEVKRETNFAGKHLHIKMATAPLYNKD